MVVGVCLAAAAAGGCCRAPLRGCHLRRAAAGGVPVHGAMLGPGAAHAAVGCQGHSRFHPVPTQPAFTPRLDSYSMFGGEYLPGETLLPTLAPGDGGQPLPPLEPIPAPQAGASQDGQPGEPVPIAQVPAETSWVFRSPTVEPQDSVPPKLLRLGLRGGADRR